MLAGIWNKNGMKFEEYIMLIVSFSRKPKVRTYQAENSYLAIARQIEYNKLKKMLVDSGYAELVPSASDSNVSDKLAKMKSKKRG